MELSPLSELDSYLFHEGTHYAAYTLFGAHLTYAGGMPGVRFVVWAPQAAWVSVVGDFNCWQEAVHPMRRSIDSSIWELFIPGLAAGTLYKYCIRTADGRCLLKADPYAFQAELRPATASVVCCLDGYVWHDEVWRGQPHSCHEQPLNIYEVHLGSWRHGSSGPSYRELAVELVDYAVGMGYTHIELLPIAEHPLDASWGYQITGYYAVTSRYGSPADFMFFVDCCHQQGLGVILDWVPGHFCKDEHGLREFDGTCLYESADPLQQGSDQWGTAYFDFSKKEVWSFLISNAQFWKDIYHIDGFRVDAVASILYLDYGKEIGQWRPNQYGGNGNLEAVAFLQQLTTVARADGTTLLIAEESTTWPKITGDTTAGGLGFSHKWNMGWMNDVLNYMGHDPLFRGSRHDLLTFSFMYAFSEHFILPLSHDEVVHGKKSLLDKMPGDYWQKFANLRLLYGYMAAHPGKKLLFMGGEFGQFREWDESGVLDWQLLEYEMHRKLQAYVRSLNCLYRRTRALWAEDDDWQGFVWLEPNDSEHSVLSFLRRAAGQLVIVVANFTPVVRHGYRIGVPLPGQYQEIFNSDGIQYGGSGVGNSSLLAAADGWQGQPCSLQLELPPLAVVYFMPFAAGRQEEEGYE